MQRIVVHRPGGFDKLVHEQADSPSAGAGEVRVETRSIGVNFADCVVRMGLYPSADEYVGWPITPGFEFAGVVTQLGKGAQRHRLGDEVFGVTRFGAYSSEVVVPETQVFPVPRPGAMLEAGALPVMALTAWYALVEQGAAGQPGSAQAGTSAKRVLVHSAAGGVGSAAVQIARALGCEVVGVVGSTSKVETVEELGASLVLDKSRQDWRGSASRFAGEGFDIVLDANGVETLRASYELLRPTGRLVVYGAHTMLTRGSGSRNWLKLAWNYLRTPRFDPLRLTNENKSVMAFNLSYLFGEHDKLSPAMEQIRSWVADGTLSVPRLEKYPLAEAATAHAALQSGRTVGKLVLVPGPSD